MIGDKSLGKDPSRSFMNDNGKKSFAVLIRVPEFEQSENTVLIIYCGGSSNLQTSDSQGMFLIPSKAISDWITDLVLDVWSKLERYKRIFYLHIDGIY